MLCCMKLHHTGVSVLLATKGIFVLQFFQSTLQTVELFKEILNTKSPITLLIDPVPRVV